MPIHIFLKQLITCQEDTQSFKRTAITFTATLLCIYPAHPNYPGCSLKGFSRSVLDVLISRVHPLPFNSGGKRGNKRQRAPSAKPSEREMHCTYRNSKGPFRSAPQFSGFRSLPPRLLVSTPTITGKKGEEHNTAAIKLVSRFSQSARLKGAFKYVL